MEEIPKLKVIYGKEEFELTEQQLDRIVAIASKKMRNEIIGMRFGFGMPIKKNELKNENDITVIKDGYESELYKAMSETLVYAIETGELDYYAVSPLIEQAKVVSCSNGVVTGIKPAKIGKLTANQLNKIRGFSQNFLLNKNNLQEIYYSLGSKC